MVENDFTAVQEEKRTYPNRLKALIEREIPGDAKIQEKIEKFADENCIGQSILKRYYYHTAKIPDETAVRLAEKYHVTVEWLMGSPLSDYDVIDILKAFSGVLRVKEKKEPFFRGGKYEGYIVRTLYMDKTFFAFLSDVKELQYQKLADVSLDDETYARRMGQIFSHYKDYFEIRFRTNSFDESRALEIEDLELL